MDTNFNFHFPLRFAAACLLLVFGFGNKVYAGEVPTPSYDLAKEPGKSPKSSLTPDEFLRQSGWRISTGVVWRDIGDVRFHTGSRSQNLRLPNLVGREFRHLPSGAGLLGEISPREYMNGFVRTDAGTGRDGFTWNWGYQDRSQIQGDQLAFKLTQGSQRTVSNSTDFHTGSWLDESEFEPGPYIEIDRLIPVGERISVGPQLNFSFINIDTGNSSSTFAQHQWSETSKFSLTDRFDLDGVIPPLAPYEGSDAGPGPLINNLPSSRSIASHLDSRSTADFFNRIDESFDLDLFTIGAGAQIEYDYGPMFFQGSGGLAINIADWEASHRETLYVSKNGGKPESYRRWTAHESGTDVLLGAYLQAKVGVQLTERWSVSGFARYDWNESLTGSVGPSSFEADLDGLSAGVVVGFTF